MNRFTGHKKAQSQRGSIVIHVAIFFILAGILFIGSELGYLFYLKRDFQKSADLAALAGAQNLYSNNCGAAISSAKSNANDGPSRNMPSGFQLADGDITCGGWSSTDNVNANHFDAAAVEKNAIKVILSRTPAPLFSFFTASRTISVQAIAARSLPKAALSINSTFLNVDTQKSAVLDSLVGGLLGGNVQLGLVGWQGLVNSQINLLSFLDALAININLKAGEYDKVLAAQATVSDLLSAMATILEKNGALVGLQLSEFKKLSGLAATLNLPTLKVSDILGVATGTPSSALDLTLQAAQLAQAFIQLASSQITGPSAVFATVNLPVLGVAANVKVIEPPQFSSIGNPELAKAAPLGADKIYVRTAQIRTLISINLGASGQLLTSLISGLSNALTTLTSALISILTTVIDLTPPGDCPVISLGCHTTPKPVISDVIALPLPIRIDINIDVAPAAAYVTDFDCTNNADKKLWAASKSNVATLRVGKMGSSSGDAKAKVFSSLATPPTVDPIALVDIGTVQSRKTCTVVLGSLCVLGIQEYQQADGTWTTQKSNAKRTAFGGGGVGLSVNPDPVSGGAATLPFHSGAPGLLKELNDTSAPVQTYLSTSATGNVAGLLIDTINGLQLNLYKPNASTGILGAILQTTDAAATAVFGLLKTLVAPLLASVINPLVEFLLKSLGIDLANAEVGARLTCRAGAELVY
ncbi:TadG family pilus assembly protein [Variovorax sp. H27-G14]